MRNQIRKIVERYVKRYGTRDPFRLADELGIIVQKGDTGECCGCYMFLKNHRYIFLNQRLEERESLMVLAHELGHAIMHRKRNCYFLRGKTLLLPGIEREANLFAAELLIPEDIFREYPEYTTEQFARLLGYHQKFVELKIRNLTARRSV